VPTADYEFEQNNRDTGTSTEGRSIGSNMHQAKDKFITIRRGEGGGAGLGGPWWSPVVGRRSCSSKVRARGTGRGRPSRPSPHPLHRPRPYGSPGLSPDFPSELDGYWLTLVVNLGVGCGQPVAQPWSWCEWEQARACPSIADQRKL